MGFFSTILGFCGFGVGTCDWIHSIRLLATNDVKDPQIRSIADQDPKAMLQKLPEIPLWVKNPDFDRVCDSRFRPIGDGGVAFANNPLISGRPSSSSDYSFYPSELPVRSGMEVSRDFWRFEEEITQFGR